MTERRRAEEALRASEERFRRAIGIGTVGVLFFGLDGRMTDANTAFERMSGYSRDELLALDWKVLTPPEFMGATGRAAAELAERGTTEPYEKQHIRKDGSRWWGLFAPTRLSGYGRDAQCVEFTVDITDSKRAEAALRATEARLRELQAELLHVSRLSAAGEMASALAHELNQPLTAATSAIQAARRMLASASSEGLERAAAGGARGHGPRGRAGAAGRADRPAPARLRRPGREPRSGWRTCPGWSRRRARWPWWARGERGVRVALRFEPGLPPVLVDRIQIQQVLFNLIRNALEAMAVARADGRRERGWRAAAPPRPGGVGGTGGPPTWSRSR